MIETERERELSEEVKGGQAPNLMSPCQAGGLCGLCSEKRRVHLSASLNNTEKERKRVWGSTKYKFSEACSDVLLSQKHSHDALPQSECRRSVQLCTGETKGAQSPQGHTLRGHKLSYNQTLQSECKMKWISHSDNTAGMHLKLLYM